MMLTYVPIRPLPAMHFFFPGRLHGYYSATPDPYPLQSFTTLVRKVCQHAVKPGNQLNLVRRWINIEPDNPHPLHCTMTKRHQKCKVGLLQRRQRWRLHALPRSACQHSGVPASDCRGRTLIHRNHEAYDYDVQASTATRVHRQHPHESSGRR